MRSIGHVTSEDGYAAVVLAGGSARRLGGRVKPAVPVAGVPMLHRVLAAVASGSPRVVVGPPELPLPAGTVQARERPPGAGPVAALSAGLAAVPAGTPWVALLAADLPLLTASAVTALHRAATAGSGDGAVFVDRVGHPQWLCGIWRSAALAEVVADAAPAAALRAVLGGLDVVELRHECDPPPWFDCDTDDDLRRAEEWTT